MTEEVNEGWKKVRFSDLVIINPKISLEKGKEYPFIEMEDLSPGNRYVSSTKKRVFKGGGSKFMLGDVLFARITPSLENGKIAQVKHTAIKGFGSTEFFVFRYREGISDSSFIYYLSFSDIIRKPAEKSMFGASGRQRADLNVVHDLEMGVPPVRTQRKIAAILSAYDDLIENNTRRIKILEEMAQTIYREWFVKFQFPGYEKVKMVDFDLGKIPEGWAVRNLFDLAEVTYGFPFKSKLFTNGPIGKPVIRIRNLKTNGTNTYTTEQAPKKHIVRNGDLLVGMDGDFHMCKWAGGEAYINQRVVRFRPMEGLPFYFLFLALEKPIHFFDSTIVGTTVAHLSDENLRSIELLVPNDALIEIVRNALDPLFNLELNLRIKNSTLRQTRDLLLPKLISGEVDVTTLSLTMEGSEA